MTPSARVRSIGVPEDHEQQHETEIGCYWWNIKQAAAYLGVSVAFLRKSVRLRKIPFARIGSKSLRFRRTDLDRWVETQGNNGDRNCAESAGRTQCPTC
jgi:excisionase family DNA binding protein